MVIENFKNMFKTILNTNEIALSAVLRCSTMILNNKFDIKQKHTISCRFTYNLVLVKLPNFTTNESELVAGVLTLDSWPVTSPSAESADVTWKIAPLTTTDTIYSLKSQIIVYWNCAPIGISVCYHEYSLNIELWIFKVKKQKAQKLCVLYFVVFLLQVWCL